MQNSFNKHDFIDIQNLFLINDRHDRHTDVSEVAVFLRSLQKGWWLPLVGLEPTILGLGGRCLIHWATEASGRAAREADHVPRRGRCVTPRHRSLRVRPHSAIINRMLLVIAAINAPRTTSQTGVFYTVRLWSTLPYAGMFRISVPFPTFQGLYSTDSIIITCILWRQSLSNLVSSIQNIVSNAIYISYIANLGSKRGYQITLEAPFLRTKYLPVYVPTYIINIIFYYNYDRMFASQTVFQTKFVVNS